MQNLTSTLMLFYYLWASLAQSQDGEGYRRSAWEDPIQFVTKAKDQCSMMVSEHGEVTNLRISCQSRDRSYWCDYQGTPHICRPYNNNPRHFFTQIMWDLRKLRNACQGQSVFKPFMCKKAPDEAQMIFVTSSSSRDAPWDDPVEPAWTSPDAMEDPTTRQEGKPWQARPDETKSDQARPEQARPERIRPNGARQRPSKASKPQAGKPDQDKAEEGKRAFPKTRTKSTRLIKVKPKNTTPSTAPPPTTPAPTSTAKMLAQQHCWPSLQSACAFVIGWFTY